MKEIDRYDAPDGYVAVKNHDGTCCECFFYQDIEGDICTLPLDDVLRPRMCSSERRADERDVIFKRKDEMSESLKTALGNLPLALERFQHYKKEAITMHHG